MAEKKKRLLLHDIIQWLEEVGNETTLKELKTMVEARIIYLKYFEDDFPV